MVIRIISPNFGACIVRSAGLCVQQTLLGHFRHIQVPDFSHLLLVAQEYIGRFHVSVLDFEVMQGFQTAKHLNYHLPDPVLFGLPSLLLILHDVCIHVASISKLHYQAVPFTILELTIECY